MNTAAVLQEMAPVRGAGSEPDTWVDAHANALYRYALTRVRNDELAQDMVQETFLAALKAHSGFAGQSSERTWLIGILKHKIIDHFRRSNREITGSDADLMASEQADSFRSTGEWVGHWKEETGPVDWSTGPDALVEQQEFWEVFQQCLGHMPERMARAFTLREMEELSTEEICSVLNITQSNFWVMIHRARMHLRRCLESRYFKRT